MLAKVAISTRANDTAVGWLLILCVNVTGWGCRIVITTTTYSTRCCCRSQAQQHYRTSIKFPVCDLFSVEWKVYSAHSLLLVFIFQLDWHAIFGVVGKEERKKSWLIALENCTLFHPPFAAAALKVSKKSLTRRDLLSHSRSGLSHAEFMIIFHSMVFRKSYQMCIKAERKKIIYLWIYSLTFDALHSFSLQTDDDDDVPLKYSSTCCCWTREGMI